MSEKTVVWELNYSRYNVVSANLYGKDVYENRHIVSGRYFMVAEYRNTLIYKRYHTVGEQGSISSFRLWLHNNPLFSREQMISLIHQEEYELAGLIFLSWMRNEECFGSIDPSINAIEMTKEDWSIVLKILIESESSRVQ